MNVQIIIEGKKLHGNSIQHIRGHPTTIKSHKFSTHLFIEQAQERVRRACKNFICLLGRRKHIRCQPIGNLDWNIGLSPFERHCVFHIYAYVIFCLANPISIRFRTCGFQSETKWKHKNTNKMWNLPLYVIPCEKLKFHVVLYTEKSFHRNFSLSPVFVPWKLNTAFTFRTAQSTCKIFEFILWRFR